MRYSHLGGVFLIAITISVGSPAFAGAEATVKGSGTANLQKPADLLHLEVQLQVRGKDVQDAVATIKQRESAIKEKLGGIAAGTVSFEPPKIESDNDPRKAYAKMTGMMNPGARKRAAPAKGVNVTTTLRADWELKGSDAEAVSLAAYQLQEKITSAAPWSAKGREGDVQQEEQEEAAEEAAGNPYLAAMPKPGQPVFSFAARFTPEERAKAAREAFARATQQATQLARAAGKTLGDLRELESTPPVASPTENSNTAEAFNFVQAMLGPAAKPKTEPDITYGDAPGQISEPVNVTAVFTIK